MNDLFLRAGRGCLTGVNRLPKFIRNSVSAFFVGILLFFAASSSSAFTFPGDHKISDRPVIDHLAQHDSEDLIIIFDEAPAEEAAAVLRAASGERHDTPEIVAKKAALHGLMKKGVLGRLSLQEAETIRDFSHLPAMVLKVKSFEALKKLAADSGTKGIYRIRAFRYFLAESLPLIGQPVAAASGYSGTGASVAVLDTGVDYLDPAFGSCAATPPQDCLSLLPAPAGCRIACVHDFAANDYARDDDGHGTNVSAIVAGVAPGAKIVGLDVFEKDGYAYSDRIISAINWVIANRAAYNIVAMNMSFGGDVSSTPCTQDEFAVPIAAARSAGVLSAVASGNDGLKNAISSPACVPAAVSVGAVYDEDLGPINWGICRDATTAPDKTTCFSNSANFLTLLAPGSEITAGGWIMSGTSQATPHVAGAVAVLRGSNAFGIETVDETLNRLAAKGLPVTDPLNGITKPRINLTAATGGVVPIQRYSLSGIITTAGLSPLKGVTVNLSGTSSATTQTDSTGKYLFTGLAAGAYRITPSKLSFTFTPASTDVSLSSNPLTANFRAKTYSISGSIRNSWGWALQGVVVNVTGCDISRSATTGSSGTYSATDLPNCSSYKVVPVRSGFSFTPSNRTVAVNNNNLSKVDFRSR